jgi:galactonate dehydratase
MPADKSDNTDSSENSASQENRSQEFLTRASSPTQQHAFRRGPRITALETVVPHEIMPGLLMLRIHTDAGTVAGTPVIGHGETYYVPTAVASVLHDWMAQRLLGADVGAVESHWRFLSERSGAFGGTGAELRALSAVDLALWDIAGQLVQRPIWRLLGGPVRDAVPVYNSCGGPFYGKSNRFDPAASGWPGHGDPGRPGEWEDSWKSVHAPDELVAELLESGYRATKLWSFDGVYRRRGGDYLSWQDVAEGVAPFHALREHAGDRLELMLDGHGFFSLAAARRIAEAMADVRPMWLEDILRPDCVETMATFRSQIRVPVAVSEMLVTADQYRQALEGRAADYVMIDPTWVGGISATRRIAELARLYNVPTLLHDCTGPLTLLAGLQVAGAVSGVAWQETVRAHIATLYPQLIDETLVVREGAISLPERSGIGARWLPEIFDAKHPGYRRTSLS